MIWKIILTTMIQSYAGSSSGVSVGVSTLEVGAYADQATCMHYARFLVKPTEAIDLGNFQSYRTTTAVCLPSEVKHANTK
jgi:hypothetical protein